MDMDMGQSILLYFLCINELFRNHDTHCSLDVCLFVRVTVSHSESNIVSQ